eukprot:TRINITY_DN6348_c0_g1_i1.p1 TRINITY_DN6348_c0_g1~~TRINITY_DN6348_c0_g1_i1.p1  ORF type:complete len:496 (-),score=118.61 TRINITY_DN6348_c0_g1_i1:10-1296(-)
MQAISTCLSDGTLKNISAAQAALNRHLSAKDLDLLQLNLNIEMSEATSEIIEWKYPDGFVDNIKKVVQEYKTRRSLLPMKIAILGPPGSGKSTLGSALADFYDVPRVLPQDVIRHGMKALEEDEDAMEEFVASQEENAGRVDDERMAQFYRDYLSTPACRNKGFVLDGFPKTYQQAADMFAFDEEADSSSEAEEDAEPPTFKKSILPEFIINLNASDTFIEERIINLPESVIAGTHNVPEGLSRRMAQWHLNNTADESAAFFFDECEVLPLPIDVEDRTGLEDPESAPGTFGPPVGVIDILDKAKKYCGPTRNYGISLEERRANKARLEASIAAAEAKMADEELASLEADKQARALHLLEWRKRMEAIEKHEAETLQAASVPLRQYLIDTVMGPVTEGLFEVNKTRPEDPIDFLAEYLFTHHLNNRKM